jgi:hypothetical protein
MYQQMALEKDKIHDEKVYYSPEVRAAVSGCQGKSQDRAWRTCTLLRLRVRWARIKSPSDIWPTDKFFSSESDILNTVPSK